MDFRKVVKSAGLNDGRRLTPHSCRIGATIDAFVTHKMDLETIRVLGRWGEGSPMVSYYLRPYLKTLDPMADTFNTDDPLAAMFARSSDAVAGLR